MTIHMKTCNKQKFSVLKRLYVSIYISCVFCSLITFASLYQVLLRLFFHLWWL